MHANYFVNTGDATAADVRALIDLPARRSSGSSGDAGDRGEGDWERGEYVASDQ